MYVYLWIGRGKLKILVTFEVITTLIIVLSTLQVRIDREVYAAISADPIVRIVHVASG